MRIVFMGTGDIAIPSFRALLNQVPDLVGLVTQPDRPVGRHQTLTPPPLKPMALEAGISILQPESLRSPDSIDALRELQPDLIIVMAYGQILSQEVLDIPSLGCVNLHASLLPRHRGAACIQSALVDGDSEIGVTLMHIVKKLDAGDIIAQKSRPVKMEETGGEAHDDLACMAAELLMENLKALEAGTAPRTPQDESLVTYAPKLLREDGRIDWSQPAEQLERLVRAYSPWPGTFTTYRDNKDRIKHLKIHPKIVVSPHSGTPGQILHAQGDVITVACGSNALDLYQVQPEGSKSMPARAFIIGTKNLEGSILGI